MITTAIVLLLALWTWGFWLRWWHGFSAGEWESIPISANLPWAGGNGASLPNRVWLFLRSIIDSQGLLEEGYNQYSRNGRPFVFANMFTGAEILLPYDQMDWIHDQPENRLSSFEAHREFMRADYTFLDPVIFHEHVFSWAIKIHLTRQLDNLMPEMADEAEQVLQELSASSSNSEDWFELNDHASWKKVVLQVVSRIYVGKPLCRDQAYLTDAATFNDASMLVAAVIGLIPGILQPILAPLVCLRDKYYHSKCAAKIKPVIMERLHFCIHQGFRDAPNDLITWAIEDALTSDDQAEHKQTLDFLAARISMMNFVSVDSTSITIENVLYDILANPQDTPLAACQAPVMPLLDHLRAEAQAAYVQYHGQESSWKSMINNLPLLDACLKESFRLNNFISRTNVRKVVNPAGLDIPRVGQIGKGVNVGFSLWGIHHDESLYPDSSRWRMTRWLDPALEKLSVFGGGSRAANVGLQYLPFGYRRHACPGRFFALRIVKLILLRLLLFYDIELPDGRRPTNPWLGVSRGPPMGGRLRFRKKLANPISAIAM